MLLYLCKYKDIFIEHNVMIYGYLQIYFIQIRVLILHHNNSFFQLNGKSINNMSHIILNLYLVFYNYDMSSKSVS